MTQTGGGKLATAFGQKSPRSRSSLSSSFCTANEQAAKVAKDALNSVENLRKGQAKLAADQEDLRKAKLSIDNMAEAVEERSRKVAAAESDLKDRQKAHAEKEAALTAKVATMRSALA